MAKNDFQYGGWNSYDPQCGTIRHWFRQLTAPCNVAYSSGIMTVNSSSGSTLQCDTWLWDDMLLNSPGGSTLQCGRWLWDKMSWNSSKRAPYWNSTSGFDFDHITAVDMSFCTMQSAKFYPNLTTLSRKKWLHVDFQDGGSQPSWILRVQ